MIDQNQKKKEEDNERSTDEYSEGHITAKQHSENDMIWIVNAVEQLKKDQEIIPEHKEKKTEDGEGQCSTISEAVQKLSEGSKESNLNLVPSVHHMKTPYEGRP